MVAQVVTTLHGLVGSMATVEMAVTADLQYQAVLFVKFFPLKLYWLVAIEVPVEAVKIMVLQVQPALLPRPKQKYM